MTSYYIVDNNLTSVCICTADNLYPHSIFDSPFLAKMTLIKQDDYVIVDGTFDNWKTLVDEINLTVQWYYTYEEYSLWKRAFDHDDFKFLIAKLKCKI